MPCDFRHENDLRDQGIWPVAGIDEAGRGPLAGPVFAAAVVLPTQGLKSGLNDSKKLTALQRETLYHEITTHPEIAFCIAQASVEEIDQLNILRATHLAMRRALAGLTNPPPVHALIDGLAVREFPIPQTPLVGGDGLSQSIAAASILAKVARDRHMNEQDALYPAYGFSRHKGYATREHLASIHEHGPCPIHRHSFSPVAQRTFSF